MKDRKEAARFIENQMDHKTSCSREKGGKSGYGWQDMRELMDFIYEGVPKSEEECLVDRRQ